jgi:putative oxidoreductase
VPPDPGSAEYLAHSLQLALATVFLYAALSKVRNPSSFVEAVRSYDLLPEAATRTAAIALLSAEFLVGVALMTGFIAAAAIFATPAILAVFFTAVGINLKRGRQIACGCVGDLAETISRRTLARLSMLLLAALAVVAAAFVGIRPLHLVAEPFAYAIEVATTACFLLAAAGWILSLREIAAIAGSRRERVATDPSTRGGI